MLPKYDEKPLSLFAQSMRDADEEFYAVFPAARTTDNWHMAYQQGHFQGECFYYSPEPDILPCSPLSHSYVDPVHYEFPNQNANVVPSSLSSHMPSPALSVYETHLNDCTVYVESHSPEGASSRTIHRTNRHQPIQSRPAPYPTIKVAAQTPTSWEERESRMRLSPLTKGGSEKKPPLACLFCRGRKIACGPPLPGSNTCNQCQRRSLDCQYPTESRRGMRKKKTAPMTEPKTDQTPVALKVILTHP